MLRAWLSWGWDSARYLDRLPVAAVVALYVPLQNARGLSNRRAIHPDFWHLQ